VRPAIKHVPRSVVRDAHERIVRCGLGIVPVSSETEDKFEDAMEVTASSPLFELARVLVRLNHVTSVIVNAAQDHFRATIARRSAVTSRPSLLKVSIRAFESSRSRNILTGEPLLPAGAKNTRIFRRLFAASGRGDTKATRSMLRTVPLGKQTNFSFMSDCKACDFIRATRILNHLILSDRASPRVWPNWCVLVKR